jgi:hypothetical protein
MEDGIRAAKGDIRIKLKPTLIVGHDFRLLGDQKGAWKI